MKAFVLACTLALVAATPTLSDWHQFKSQFGKQYLNIEEESYRKSVYEQNQEFIDSHNEKYENGIVTFNLEMNQFGDMTREEINAAMNGYVPNNNRQRRFIHQSSRDVPKEVDWRAKGAVTPVKDQGGCGSCWAFSTTGSLEGQHFLKTGKLVSLSEQNLVDCSDNYGDHGCGGGNMDNAFTYVKANHGIDTEKSYPYEGKDDTCRFKAGSVGATCTGFVDVKSGDEDALKSAVGKIGPVSVAIDDSLSTFHFYKSGVYYDAKCSPTHLGHAVLAVGYGAEDKLDYWLVKNSWNTTWGDKGYIKMSRNRDNNCGIATMASYPTV